MNQLIKKKKWKNVIIQKTKQVKTKKKGEAFTFSIYRFVDVKQLDLERNYAENEKEKKNRDLLQSWLNKKKGKTAKIQERRSKQATSICDNAWLFVVQERG